MYRISVITLVTILFTIAVPPMASAASIDDRVIDACQKLYVHGVTQEIADREVGRDGVPALLRLLADPKFPRRDNVVAFLWQLGAAESTDPLLAFLTAPPAAIDTPEEDRAMRLAPPALGKIAARGDHRALAALLAITDPNGNGGPLAGMTVRGRDASSYRQELIRMAYHGLAFSGDAGARSRLATLAGAGGNARRSRDAQQALGTFDSVRAATGGAPTDGGSSGGAVVEPAFDTQTRLHETPITYANHVDTDSPMYDVLADVLMAAGSQLIGLPYDATDVGCCVTFERSAPGGTFGTPGDGLDGIDNQTEFDAVATAAGGRLKVVDYISWCGSFFPNIAGCAYTPGYGGAVVRETASHDDEAILWLHEYGHNAGLPHNATSCYIMNPSVSSCGKVTQAECNTYHSPFGGGTADIGSCVDGDGDDVYEGLDNCPADANTDQTDSDHDGIGDVCDLCGNGVHDPGEECDDVFDGGTCHNCHICGNGIIAATEECDDGDWDSGDGCSEFCERERCWQCTGEPSICTPDDLDTCSDGDACTIGETCSGGWCQTGTPNTSCTNGDGCCPSGCAFGNDDDCPPPIPTPTLTATRTPTPTPTLTATATPTCAAAPVGGCRTPAVGGKASLQLKEASLDTKDQLQWKWSQGSVTTKADYGAPTTSTPYQLCIYNGTPTLILGATIPPGGMCGTTTLKPCWKDKATGFDYKDKALTPAGIEQLKLKEGLFAGKAQIQVKGKGSLLDDPTIPLVQPITVQLNNTSSGLCWEATYSAPATKNEAGQFKDKAD